MDHLRVVGAMAVSLGIPVFAVVYPGSARSAPKPRPAPELSFPAAATVETTSTSVSVISQESGTPPAPPAIFEKAVVRLAAEADSVDRVWQTFRSDCGVRVLKGYDFGREWFALLDRAAHATIDKPGCVPLRRIILLEGEDVRHDLRSAQAAARRARVDEATEIGLLRWHGLEWR